MVITNENFYKVVEVMVLPNGNIGEQAPVNYETKEDAEARFFAILGEAVKSEVPFHGCFILESTGTTIEGRVFDRRGNGWYWDEDENVWKKGVRPEPTPETAAE